MHKNHKSYKKHTSGGNTSSAGVLPSVLLGIGLNVAVFAAVILISAAVLFLGGMSAEHAWLGYMAATWLSAGIAAGYTASKLPLRGIVTALIWALGSIVLHSVLIAVLNPDAQSQNKLVILIGIIAVCVVSGTLGGRLKSAKKN
ncbi:MAG: hypothetical protein IJ766_05540 [Clostridia bacterium]|nr:hypothetical protein [Clostridia bacterium]